VIGRRGDGDGNVLLLLLVVGAAVPIPLVLSTPQTEVAVRVVLVALIAVGWNVMGGFGGHFSFGHAAYFGIGAYTTAWLLNRWGWSPWLGMAVGAVLAAAFATLTGYLCFRYRLTGAYFALATLAFAEMLRHIASNSDVVNRAAGFRVPLRPGDDWWMLQFAPGSPKYFFVALGLLAAALLVVIAVVRRRAGYYIVALREDEAAAASLGVDTMRYKLLTVAISGAITSVGGAFYFMFLFFIDPELAFGVDISVQAILPAIIGGTGTIWGPPIGAVILVLLGEYTSSLTRSPPRLLSFLDGRSGADLMIFGVLLIVIILFLPRGLVGTLAERRRTRRSVAVVEL
jgi:branched-chain amino acid transport system permease protein